MEQAMCVDQSDQSNLIMEQIPTYPMGEGVLKTHRDKHRERFDVPDHPLWEELNITRLLPPARGSLQDIYRPGRGHAAMWSNPPTLKPTLMFDGDSPPQWSLEELRERYNPQSPLGSDDEPDEPDDPSLSPESVMGHNGSSLSLASDTSYMLEYDTPNTPPSPPWSTSS